MQLLLYARLEENANKKVPPEGDFLDDNTSGGAIGGAVTPPLLSSSDCNLVAGVGFEPTTFWL